jgi:uncharacterized lipoprotein YmbA
MRRRASIAAVCAACIVLAAGCGSSPPAHFYRIAAAPMPASAPSTTLIAVGPVTVPAVVDRPEIVVSASAHELTLDDFNRWGSPLSDNLSRVIAENLSALLGTPRVILFPNALATEPEYRVAVEVRVFDSMPGTAAAIDATWTVRRVRDGKTETGRTAARETTADASYEALAAAHSRAIARLSVDIANAIRALQRGGG